MINLIIKSDDQNFIKHFFSESVHNWIRKDKDYYRAFTLLFECLPSDIKLQLIRKNKLVFIKVEGQYASSLELPHKKSFVIIYNDLLKLLKGPYFPQGVAVLAHEIGHIINHHAKRQISILDSQFEADQFVIDIGLEEELIDFLSDHIDVGDCKIRLDKILLNK